MSATHLPKSKISGSKIKSEEVSFALRVNSTGVGCAGAWILNGTSRMLFSLSIHRSQSFSIS